MNEPIIYPQPKEIASEVVDHIRIVNLRCYKVRASRKVHLESALSLPSYKFSSLTFPPALGK